MLKNYIKVPRVLFWDSRLLGNEHSNNGTNPINKFSDILGYGYPSYGYNGGYGMGGYGGNYGGYGGMGGYGGGYGRFLGRNFS